MVTAFCGKLGWHSLELLLGQFQERLQFGIHRELIELCRLTCLNGQRARVLFNAGIDSIAILANTNIADVENLLENCAPFESGKAAQGETDRDAKERRQLRSFWVTGQKGVTEAEAAKLIVEEAREILQKDLGVEIKNWGSPDNETVKSKSVLSPNSNHMSFLNKSVKTKKTVPGGKTKRKRKTPNNSTTKQHSYQIQPPKKGIVGQNKSKKEENQTKNVSFDMSAQMEDIFGEEENEKEPKKRVSWGDKTEISPEKGNKRMKLDQ